MRRRLRVLILEDHPSDAELMVCALVRHGFDVEWQRVETETDFVAHLDPNLDIIVADYYLPQFDAPRALAIAAARLPDVPAVIVSGSIGDDVAVEAMRCGAADYLLKDRLARLGPAVEHALAVRDMLREKKRAEQELHRVNRALRVLGECNRILVRSADEAGLLGAICQAIVDIGGYCNARVGLVSAEGGMVHVVATAGETCGAPHGLGPIEQAMRRGTPARRRCAPSACATDGRRCGIAIPLKHEDVLLGALAFCSADPDPFHVEEVALISELADDLAYGISMVRVREAHREAEAALRASEAALRQSEARARSLVDNAVHGICGSTPGGEVLQVNPAMVSMLGYDSPAELCALPASAMYRDPGVRLTLVERYHETGRIDGVETEFVRKDGKPVLVRLSGRTIYGDDGTIERLETIVEDVTSRRQLEDQLRQSQKIEAIGHLAGGIAHDFNNLLTAILGYSELVLEQMGPDDSARTDIMEIKRAGESAAALTQQLLAFSRKQILQAEIIDLNGVIRSVDKMLCRVIGEDIELVLDLAGDLGPVKADPGQVEQVIMNLAVNARDAMPEGGKVTIRTANAVFDERYVQAHLGAVAGRYAMMEVSDTGCGITREVLARIFEPFFTTKEHGKGTGLGLSTVYGIVKQSGGYLWVSSDPGQGATFQVFLPLTDHESAPASAKKSAPAIQTGKETVLLVDDDDRLRELARRTLQRAGYNVLAANDADRALDMAGRHPGAIHLLLTDVVLPGISGRGLAEQFQHVRPEARILYMSGYTGDAIVRHGIRDARVAFLQKPYTPDVLQRKVREVLDAGAPDSAA